MDASKLLEPKDVLGDGKSFIRLVECGKAVDEGKHCKHKVSRIQPDPPPAIGQIRPEIKNKSPHYPSEGPEKGQKPAHSTGQCCPGRQLPGKQECAQTKGGDT